MGEFAQVMVPVSFEAIPHGTEPPEGAIELRTDRHVQVGPATIEALRLASRLASGGLLRLVHATPDLTHLALYGGPEGSWFPVDTGKDIHTLTEHRSRVVLAALAKRYVQDVEVEYHVAPGAPTTVILAAAAQHRPDAIVIAASGRGIIRRTVLGSTANKIIRQATCPVVVIPGSMEYGRHTTEAPF